MSDGKFELLGHDNPFGHYPAPVVPIGRLENALVVIYAGKENNQIVVALDKDVSFVSHEETTKSFLRDFNYLIHRLFAFDKQQVVFYPIQAEQSFLADLLNNPIIRQEDPFFRLALAKGSKRPDLITAEMVSCLDEFDIVKPSSDAFIKVWYAAQRATLSEETAIGSQLVLPDDWHDFLKGEEVSNHGIKQEARPGKSRRDDTEEPVPRSRPSARHSSYPQTLKKEWTLMFFFASDTRLSPSSLSPIKAIKAAGFHVDTNVLVYFDPNEKGAPTRVLEINKDREKTIASYHNPRDPFISLLSSDYVSPDEIGKGGPQSKEFANSLQIIDAQQADTALRHFLSFCCEAYPAEHYMLFLVGQGLVVGRDAFLPDDNPDSAIGLKKLGQILNEFNNQIGDDALEFIGMDSCSMSAVEVAYELKGTARYMLASQGPSFIGSWPYRHLLTRLYNDLDSGKVDVSELMRRLHALCITDSLDLVHTGYSSDLCLCCLDSDRIEALNRPLSKLSLVLQSGLAESGCRNLIVLAHWKAQSYWQERYSDLYDFCYCLSHLCREAESEVSTGRRGGRRSDLSRLHIIDACAEVMNTLKPENSHRGNGPVVCADYVGPDAQYSHGLSIYFPWSRPLADDNDHVINHYKEYAFTQMSAAQQTWLRFLHVYFEKTKRPDRISEEQRAATLSRYSERSYQTVIGNLRQSLSEQTATSTQDFFAMSALEGKGSPPDSSSGSYSSTSIKNYPRVFSMSPSAATVFSSETTRITSAAESDPDAS